MTFDKEQIVVWRGENYAPAEPEQFLNEDGSINFSANRSYGDEHQVNSGSSVCHISNSDDELLPSNSKLLATTSQWAPCLVFVIYFLTWGSSLCVYWWKREKLKATIWCITSWIWGYCSVLQSDHHDHEFSLSFFFSNLTWRILWRAQIYMTFPLLVAWICVYKWNYS